ncbi:MAG: phenylacetate--CoA ligase [Ruminococcaceae bacterium]|nr:phenylacetate--CoA ligase [Oscillospiraceae bacterium]
MNFWQKDIETMKRSDIEALQLAKLKKLVDYCYNNVPFYKKKLDDAKVTADKIKQLSDIKYIPYTTKEDIRDNYPFGLFAVPKKEVVRIHASSGTTGKPTVVGYTKNDVELWTNLVSRIVVSAGATADDVAQVSFGYGLFTGALGLHYGLERIGATVIPASSGNTEKQIMLMEDLGTTTLISTPSYALYMSEVAKEMGKSRENFKLRLGLMGSEGCTDEMRDKLEEAWGLFVTDNYGMSELTGPGVSGECIYRCGLHIAEDHYIPEIISSETLEVLDDPSQSGELVFTTLSKEAFPLLRYRTKDISSLNYEVCQCGRTHVRMKKVTARADDMLKVKGVNVFPSQIESILVKTPHISPNYQLVLTTKNYMDSIEVRVELTDGSLLEKYSELENLQNSIHQNIKTILGIDVKITLLQPKTIERTAGKAKRIVDMRGKKTI